MEPRDSFFDDEMCEVCEDRVVYAPCLGCLRPTCDVCMLDDMCCECADMYDEIMSGWRVIEDAPTQPMEV